MIILNIKNTACCFTAEHLPFILTACLFVYPSLLNIFPSKSFLISQIKFVRKYKCVFKVHNINIPHFFLITSQPRTQTRKGVSTILLLVQLKTMERLSTRLSKEKGNTVKEMQNTDTFEILRASLRWGGRGRNQYYN